ncbi:MAG: biopolymer transporter ExbD, partial [Burkholderiaceae bacterium]|nr:biopolymer transporter ExbD [Burkholderiaceae bacterium]
MALNYKRLPGDEDALISQINTTPLVDVMLVLLIIFLITIPVVSSSVMLQLPRESSQARQSEPGNIIVSVDAAGGLYWFDTPRPDAQALLE